MAPAGVGPDRRAMAIRHFSRNIRSTSPTIAGAPLRWSEPW